MGKPHSLLTIGGAICTALLLVSVLLYVESQLLRQWQWQWGRGKNREPQLEPETAGSEARTTRTTVSSYLGEAEHDADCLARSEQHQYRRPGQRFPPSKALEESWERYLSLRKLCSSRISNWTEAFVMGPGASSSSCRYLIFMEGSAGLGNKILALVSAFLYALATDRVLVLETGGGKKLGSLLCQPFPGSSWLLPEDFPYEAVRQAPALGAAWEAAAAGRAPPPVVNLHLEHIQSAGDQSFFCDSTHHAVTRDVTWLAWSSTQYYASRLLMLPSFWHRLVPLFPPRQQQEQCPGPGDAAISEDAHFSVFTQLARLIVVPQNPIWKQLLRVYKGYLSSSGARVGVQIRLHGRWDLAAFDSAVHARVLQCLQEHRLLPRLIPPNGSSSSSSSASSSQPAGDGGSVAVLVASLQQRYYQEMKREYSEGASDDGRLVSIHSCGEGGQQDETMRQARTALLEMWLLSLSDAIATSAYSTFGYVAHGLAGLRPLIMNVRGETLEPGEPCSRGISSEPCTHFPMEHPDCPNASLGNPVTAQHQDWMDSHVHACQDQEGGLQLVWNAESCSPAGAGGRNDTSLST